MAYLADREATVSPRPRHVMTVRHDRLIRARLIHVSISAGSIVGAARRLGISESTARQHLSGLYRRTGCVNAAQAAYWLGAWGKASSDLTEV